MGIIFLNTTHSRNIVFKFVLHIPKYKTIDFAAKIWPKWQTGLKISRTEVRQKGFRKF